MDVADDCKLHVKRGIEMHYKMSDNLPLSALKTPPSLTT